MPDNLFAVVLEKNTNSQEVIKSYLETIPFIDNIKLYTDYYKGFEAIKAADNNAVVIMDISEINDEIKEIADSIKLYTSRLIITSTDYSTDTIIRALRCGAKDFLPKPVIKEDLIRTITRLANLPADSNTSQSQIITVFSNKGGIGKTTVAVNLAEELAKVTKDKVALVDLNLQLGDISTFLNLNPMFDVNYVIKKIMNEGGNNLVQMFEKYKDTSLYVLADPSYIEQSSSITQQQISMLFSALRKNFPYIVVDMASNIDSNTLTILDNADLVLFTTIVNIPAIRNAQRCLNLFRSRKYDKEKVKLIINRYMENDEIKAEDIENTLGQKIYWKIPNNYFTIMEAINKGVCIAEINPNSNIGNNFRDFALKLSDDIIEKTVCKYRI